MRRTKLDPDDAGAVSGTVSRAVDGNGPLGVAGTLAEAGAV
jgi:hypothetical protein